MIHQHSYEAQGMANPLVARFLRWLLPDRYSEFAQCEWCGVENFKDHMFRSAGGWFCSEQHAAESWWDEQ
jgi:hypothetical protein